jgi:7-cyano-7-deazaguanine synthase
MSELLLLSGGIDSIAIAAWRRPKLCLTVDYGHRPAAAEIIASAQVCKDLKLQHCVLSAKIPSLGSGDLAGADLSPHSRHSEFWPFRNQYLITLAGMIAIKHACDTVAIGTVATDVRHKDGSAAFVSQMNALMLLQEGSLRVVAPAASFTSEELVHRSLVAPATLAWAHSCHVGNLACNQCRGCQKHSETMSALGLHR